MTCADDYYESLDIETARQPQSLLCYEMSGRPLDRGHGAPLRLSLPTKLGYKQSKYLMTLDVTHVLPEANSYWGDQATAGMADFEPLNALRCPGSIGECAWCPQSTSWTLSRRWRVRPSES